MWEPRRLITLWAFMACYRDSFIIIIIIVENIKKVRKFMLYIFFRNYESVLNYLHFKTLYSRRHLHALLYFISTPSRTKLSVVLFWLLLGSVYPLSKLGTFPPSTSAIPQDLALQQGASQLQTASADLWTRSINILSHLRIRFPLLNSIKLMVPVTSWTYYLYCFSI
jgi:hypothetical protein